MEEELQSEPLDLSLPKSSPAQANVTTKLPISAQKEPLNLTCLKKQELPGNTIYVAQTSTGPLNIMATSLPTLVAIAEPGGVPCIGATVSGNKRTIFIPQLTYTYTSNVKTADSTAVNTKGMVVLNSCLVRKAIHILPFIFIHLADAFIRSDLQCIYEMCVCLSQSESDRSCA